MSDRNAMSWSKEQTMVLIELYRQYPCLWNVKSKDYKDGQKRDAELTSILTTWNHDRN